MPHPALTPDPDQPTPAEESPPDPAVLRAEERLVVLEELREIGMELARALLAGAKAGEGAAGGDVATDKGGAKGRDPGVAFAQLSRAIRLTLGFEARTDEELRGLKAGVIRQREEKRARAVQQVVDDAHRRLHDRQERIVELVMDAAAGDMRSPDDYGRLDQELDERLLEDEDFWTDPQRPMRDIVERLCRYFSLTPDWSRWDGEGWTRDDSPPLWPWAPAPEARATDAASPGTPNGAAAGHALE